MASDYTSQALIERVKLKAFTSTSTSLSDQQILDLANDSLRSYVVPILKTLREEFLVTADDDVLTSDSDGRVTVPSSVASTLRLVSWDNAGILTPLVRIEPEMSFQYLAMGGNLPMGYELRGYTLQLLPKVPNIALHLSYMARPPQMVLTSQAALVDGGIGPSFILDTVPLEWQETTPTEIDLISGESPFSVLATYGVVALNVNTHALQIDTTTPTLSGGEYVSDVGTSPFAMIPIELYPLLEVDVVATLFQALGDPRLNGILSRKKELENLIKRTLAPRTTGSARPIVNPSSPGMRSIWGYWPRR
jgi:hypothetical protein